MLKSIYAFFITIFLVSCSGGGNNTPETIDKTIYDLSEYLFPSTNQINVYNEEHDYKTGNEDYLFDYEEDTYKQYNIKNNEINMTIDQILTNIYQINASKIKRVEYETQREYFIDTKAQVNDTIVDEKFYEEESELDIVINYSCILTDSFESKVIKNKRYNSLLETTCIEESSSSGIVSGSTIEVYISREITTIYAKDVGIVSLIDESCKRVSVDRLGEEKCEIVNSQLTLEI